jgi:hypothetical protein
LQKLLVLDPKKRLGSKGDAKEIMKHPFFRGINFDHLREKKLAPPYKFDLATNEFKFFDPKLVR